MDATIISSSAMNAEPRLYSGQMTCKRQILGQHASCRSLRHKIVKGTAICLQIFFKMAAGIWSGPVALVSSNCSNYLKHQRERKTTNSSNSISAQPKKGQSTCSMGSCAFASNVLAKRSAFSRDSFNHLLPSRNGGIEKHLPCFERSSLFSDHHSLLPFFSPLIFVRNLAIYLLCSSFSTRVHLARALSKLTMFSAAFFSVIADSQMEFSHGCTGTGVVATATTRTTAGTTVSVVQLLLDL